MRFSTVRAGELTRSISLAITCLTVQLLFCNSFLPVRAQSSSPEKTPPHSSLPNAPSASQEKTENPSALSAPRPPHKVDAPWPREVDRGAEKIAMFQPQLERWKGEELRAYAALSVAKKDSTDN